VSYASFLLTIPFLAYDAYKLYIKHKTPEPVQIDIAVMKRFDQVQEEFDKLKSKVNANNLEKNIAAAPKRYF